MQIALTQGVDPLIEGILGRWFTAEYRHAHPDEVAKIRSLLQQVSPAGFAACCAAIRDMDQRESIRRIAAPTLIIAGRHDPATPVEAGEFMRSRIPDAALTILAAAHLSNIEKADDYTERVLGFLLPPHS